MMKNWVQTSVLHAFHEGNQAACIESTDLRICEMPFGGKLLIQARGHIDQVRQVVLNITGLELPPKPNTCSSGTGDCSALLWLGPEKYLLILNPDKLRNIQQQLDTALVGIPNLLSDISDARTGFEVSSKLACTLLAKVCALDLDWDLFGPGLCAQSMLVRVPMLLHQLNDQPTFHLYVDRSVTRYAWDWLSDAASELIHSGAVK